MADRGSLAYASKLGVLVKMGCPGAYRGFVHVPVIDAAGRPSGVVNARDALRELMAEGQYEEALLRDYVMGVGYR